MDKVSCNICGSSDFTIIYRLPDLLLGHKDELFTLVRCDHCGLLYQNPRPGEDEIGKYYPSEYEPFYQEQNKNWLMKRIYRYGIEKRSRIINSLDEHRMVGRLLDIGCSTGLFLNEIRKSDKWKVNGVELSEHAAQIARQQFDLDVFTGTLFQASYPADYFDIVTLWDVLEHLPNPSAAFEEISRISKHNSYLVLRIPNAESFDAKLFGSNWAGLDLPRHLYVFSNRTVSQLLEMNGYEVKNISCNIGTYPTFVLSIRFWFTNRGINTSVQNKVLKILDHPIMRLITAPFFYIYGLMQLGSEITVIAKKK